MEVRDEELASIQRGARLRKSVFKRSNFPFLEPSLVVSPEVAFVLILLVMETLFFPRKILSLRSWILKVI